MLVCALMMPWQGEVVPGTSRRSPLGGGPLGSFVTEDVDDGGCVGNAS